MPICHLVCIKNPFGPSFLEPGTKTVYSMPTQKESTKTKKSSASLEWSATFPAKIPKNPLIGHYWEIISLALYVPQTLHTWWASFNSPHSEHFTIPGTASLKWVRRLSRRVLDVLRWGTAIIPTSLTRSTRITGVTSYLIQDWRKLPKAATSQPVNQACNIHASVNSSAQVDDDLSELNSILI